MLDRTKTFFSKVKNAMFGNVDSKKVKRINAAFGSFLLVALTGLTQPMMSWIGGFTSEMWGSYLMLLWLAFLGFLSVLIVSFFGAEANINVDLKALLAEVGIDIDKLKGIGADVVDIIEDVVEIKEDILEAIEPESEPDLEIEIVLKDAEPDPEPEPEVPEGT